jgi:putative transposase
VRRYVERVLVRYRYRAYPTPGQTQLLARAFGCARVVFNDALLARRDAYAAGEKISDTQVQRRVVTLAKTTPQRQWLGEVASVALVQACQDARRAYRNWFDSLSGKRKGRKVGHPRFRSRKDNRASIRLTRNGFSVTTGGVRVAKVGDVRVVWSRVLPSVPSSVTVIREADGRYYASFVVEVADTPLPQSTNDVGIDLGLTNLAVLSTGEVIENPRHLRRKARVGPAAEVTGKEDEGIEAARQGGTAGSLSSIAGSGTPAWTHITNWPTTSPAITKGSTCRTWPCPAWPGPGWASRWPTPAGRCWCGCWQEKALRCHQAVVRVSRWFPCSRLCSVCGVNSGKKPLAVRSWTCPQCGIGHDRDLNAARNILVEGRMVAAGLAETLNARGGGIRGGLVPAAACEGRTHQGAA